MISKQIKIHFEPQTHIPALDGLRGIAVLMILIYHHFGLLGGWMGVDLFFVLSGFLITGILLDKKNEKGYYKNFIIRRALRIFPLYYFALVLFFILLPLLINQALLDDLSIYFRDENYFWAYLQNWIFMVKVSEYEQSNRALMHFWSLAIEEQFYLIWPFIIYIFNKKILYKALIFIIILALGLRVFYLLQGYHWGYGYLNTFSRLDSLAFGSLGAVLIRDFNVKEGIEKIAPKVFYISFILLLILIIILKPNTPSDIIFRTFGFSMISLFFVTLLFFAISVHERNGIKMIAENRILRFFGKYSYSMYIFHFPIIWLIRPMIYKSLDNEWVGFVIGNSICIAITIIISISTWILIEKPLLNLKKYFN